MATVHLDSSMLALQAEERRRRNVIVGFIIITFSYCAVFGSLFTFVWGSKQLGSLHLAGAALTAVLALYFLATKRLQGLRFSLGLLAAVISTYMALTGSIGGSGLYATQGAAVFLYFFLSYREYIVLNVAVLTTLIGAFALSLIGLAPSPYPALNYLLLIADFLIVNSLLTVFGREREKLDFKLKSLLQQVQDLAHSLRVEKEKVEDKVRARTRQYREEHAYLVSSINSLQQGFLLVTAGSNVQLVNEQARKMFKLGTALTGDLPLAMATNSVAWSERLQSAVRQALRLQRTKRFEVVDAGFSYQLYVTPVLHGEHVLGATVIIENITEAKILERSRDEFFSIASHELRTPLTAIRGNMSMAKDYFPAVKADNELHQLVDDTHTASIRLIEIVNDFLDSSKLEQGKMVFSLRNVAIAPLIASIVDDLKPLSTQQQNIVAIDPTIAATPRVKADDARLRQVLYNIISNANKYCRGGRITISGEANDKEVTIHITDTGKGISPENQKLLFHKFQQAGGSILTRDNTKGTGLGLYISQLMMNYMGGEIRLESSAEGKGSVFGVTIRRESKATKS